MSIASQITRINTNIAAAYDEAEAKGATMPATENSANLAQTVASIPEAVQPTLITKQITENGTYAAEDDNADGYSEVKVDVAQPQFIEEKDVNFYDYDGTLLYSYTFAEVLLLSNLPNLPEHENIIAEEWNYTLSEIKEYADANYKCIIGVTYTNQEHAHKLFLTINNPNITDVILNVRGMGGTLNVFVNGQINASHIFGNFEAIQLTATLPAPIDQTLPRNIVISLAFEGNGYCQLGFGGDNGYSGRFIPYQPEIADSVYRIELCSANISPLRNAFYGFRGLKHIIISKDASGLTSSGYADCSSLEAVIIPKGSNLTVPEQTFTNCVALKTCSLPNNIKEISSEFLRGCNSLEKFTIPKGITLINSFALDGLTKIKELSFPNTLITMATEAVGTNASVINYYLPDSLTNVANNAFIGCTSLQSIRLSKNMTQINGYILADCYCLGYVFVPNTITVIGGGAFRNDDNLVLDLSDYKDANTIPVLNSVNAFAGIYSTVVLLVYNQEMLEAFTAATNWSTLASRFQIKEVTP